MYLPQPCSHASSVFQTRSEIRAVRPGDGEPPGEVSAEPGDIDGGAEATRPRPHDRPEGCHLQLRPARQQTCECHVWFTTQLCYVLRNVTNVYIL